MDGNGIKIAIQAFIFLFCLIGFLAGVLTMLIVRLFI
jgi:hypothetical protein